jgi:peptidoglycan/LPS O-acetylase OafA/YrhL
VTSREPLGGPAAGTAKPRYAFVDALRGIAAVLVVLFHVYSKNLLPMTGYRLPEPFHTLFDNGNAGVYIFFVISGFVIAHSIRGERVTPRYAGWFAARRALRLDPPYWATIAAMIALTFVSNHAQHQRSLPMPSAGQVAAHLGYLQGFLGYPQIVGVFWTLCYEIQFYLALVVGVGVAQAAGASRWLVFGPLAALSLVSVIAAANGWFSLTPALAVYAWPYFFLGVCVAWVHNDEQPAWVFYAVAAVTLVIAPFAPVQTGVAVATAAAIFGVARAGKLAAWTLGRVCQYLGRISYSLYLVHMLVGTPLVRFGVRLFGNKADLGHTLALFGLALGASIVAAHVFHLVIERPAQRLSHRLHRFDRPRTRAAA